MTRALLTVREIADRERATRWVASVPVGTRIEFKAPKRTVPQNDRMWAMLTDIAQQVEWYGQRLSTQDWKDVLTASLRKSRVVPGLDAGSFVVLGLHTSALTKEEFSDLIELIHAFGAEHNVKFHDPVMA